MPPAVGLGGGAVAIERPDGLLIERLLDAGVSAIAIHPNQVAAMRPRFSAAGGKSESFDSFVLAELARTDSHRYRILVPDSDATKALRALSRAREDLVGTRVALANELRAQLGCFWPGAANVFSEIDSLIALAFLKQYPTPVADCGLGEQRLARFLARHSYSGGKAPRELLGRLRDAAQGRAGTLETSARGQVVLALVAALEPIVAKIAQLTKEIRRALAEHTDGETFRSLFKDPSSAITAATMLAEMGDCRERYPTKQALAADGGQSPVAVESGKSKPARPRERAIASAKRDRHAREQQPPAQPVGRGHLQARDRTRRHHPHAIRILVAPGAA